jgi:hypothetical protein
MSIVSSIVKHLVKSTLGSEMPCFRAAQIAAPNQSQEFKRKKSLFFLFTYQWLLKMLVEQVQLY